MSSRRSLRLQQPARVRDGAYGWRNINENDAGLAFSVALGVHGEQDDEAIPYMPYIRRGNASNEQTKVYVAIPGRSFEIRCKRLVPNDKRWGGRVYIDKGVNPPPGSFDHEFWFPEAKDCSQREACEYTIDGYCLGAEKSRCFVFKDWLDICEIEVDNDAPSEISAPCNSSRAGMHRTGNVEPIAAKDAGCIVVRIHEVEKFKYFKDKRSADAERSEPPQQVRRLSSSSDIKKTFLAAPGKVVIDKAADRMREAVLKPAFVFQCLLQYIPVDHVKFMPPATGKEDYFKFVPMEVLADEKTVRSRVLESLFDLSTEKQHVPVTLGRLLSTINTYMCPHSSRLICGCATPEQKKEACRSVVQGPSCTGMVIDGEQADEDPDFHAKLKGLYEVYEDPQIMQYYYVTKPKMNPSVVQGKESMDFLKQVQVLKLAVSLLGGNH
mmetsp:Transcript_40167/g.66672  ORF Transcript_40167/g.66672 Transcript_40167/m.66672 type:complete len:438 (+) Transcript_40167:12-1325(+)|eukprot:CAMPEP_0119303164 /NCGR_PEP_ID=MMETSP1333-20130426/4646_1 /TAXON_ID=418940 /ORGANISM="Scyphosphaera apsteinii, Strain RCC1455" /LENGTH=437 /DNA_ID=CAMNT_0007305765 /DNA_START=12 /DNA_END=1325 /DNA_ORIENTATION=+